MTHEFQQVKLRGTNFKGRNFVGSDFSRADIRGVNFSNAILIGANFSNAKAGLPTSWMISLVALSWFLSLLAGLVAGYAGALIGDLFSSKTPELLLFSYIAVVTLISFLVSAIRRGLEAKLVVLAEIFAACLIAVIAFLPENQSGLDLAISADFTVLALAGAMAGVSNMAVAVAVARAVELPGSSILAGLTALVGIALGALLGVKEAPAYGMTGCIAFAVIVTGSYIGWQSIAENKKHWLVRSLAIAIVAKGGTNFRGANLTEVNFTQATLKSTDFRNANLTRICWFQAQKLDQARVEGTYLEHPQIRQLGVTRDGRDQNFDHLDLRGLDLKDATLQGASFVGSDLGEATLEGANLFTSKLVQTQLYKTNLTGACLTGAYIQNWGISTDTKLEAVKCEYIYMQLPTKEDPDPCRKPDDRHEVFREGDFADFIAPIIKTLDLYQTQNVDLREMASTFKTLDLFHHRGIDPAAAAIALQQLVEKYPEAGLEVVALEGRGNEKIRVQAVVMGNANRSVLSAEYFSKYRQMKSLPYRDLQTLLAGVAEKDERIYSLEQLLREALQQPRFYAETYQNQGEFIMSQSKGNVNISGNQGNVSGIAAAGENQTMAGVAIGEISGSITNMIEQLPESSDPNQPGIKELLAQLQAEIEAEAELSDEDKAEALEQVRTLAEAGKIPREGILQKSAKTAMKILKGTVSSLPDAAKLTDACAKLLPLISKLLLLG